MARRTVTRLLSAIAVFMLPQVRPTTPASSEGRPAPTVLTIHWGPESFPGTQVVDAAIREAVSRAGPVRYYAEYLKTEDFPPETASLALRDYIHHNFEGRHIDVVIADAGPALQFTLRFRELFPAAPIVFVSGRIPDVIMNHAAIRVTGIVNDAAFAETLDLALRLHPFVRQVFVVAQAPVSEGYDERVRAALRPFSQRTELTYIQEPSVSRLLAAVKAVPAQSLILYTRYTPEEADTAVYPDQIARLMADVSPVPIYCATDLYMGSGVVGGMIRGSYARGRRLGEIARQILDGTPPEQIPVGFQQVVPTFDWRQVRRWGIDPSRLPPGSDILFKTPTTWESYRRYIVGIVAVIAGQILLIAALAAQRARRRRADERIRHLAGRLINAEEVTRAALARELHDGVCQELAAVSIAVNGLKNSSGLIQDAHTQHALSKLHDETLGIVEGIRRLSHDLHPAALHLLGLAAALKAHCSEVAKRNGVHVGFTIQKDLLSVSPDVALTLFRVAQESLRNGIEHGQALRLSVSLTRSGDDVELTVSDDGWGFDLDAARRDGRGLGLVSMEERARSVGGQVQIVTGLHGGTTIRVRCPAAAREALE